MATKRKEKVENKLSKVFKNSEIGIIDELSNLLDVEPKTIWNEEGNELKTELPNGGKIFIKYPETEEGEFIVEYDKKSKAMIDKIINTEKNKLTEHDLNNSIFKFPFLQNYDYLNIDKNKKLFLEIEKEFKSMGITEIGFHSTLVKHFDETVFDDLTLVFSPSPYNSADNSILPESTFHPWKDIKGFVMPTLNHCHNLLTIENEIVKEIKLNGKMCGHYYKERNLIFLYFNPFIKLNLSTIKSISKNKFLETLMDFFKTEFNRLKIKKVDISDFNIRMIINSFNKYNNERLIELRHTYNYLVNEISDTDTKLINKYEQKLGLAKQINTLSIYGNEAVDMLTNEINKIKNISIIEKVDLVNNSINITFIPTTIKVNFSRSVSGNGTIGIREMYLGRITVHIYGDGTIKVTSDAPTLTNHSHPHSNSENKPCLGSGLGSNTIHQLIGERKISDFCYVFWMWIKKWRPEDCYVKPHQYYDDRLMQGYPVFDQSGKRIDINDPKKIKSGEQLKLTKSPNYDTNIDLFKDFKSQK